MTHPVNGLQGRCIWLTRPRAQIAALQEKVEAMGASVLALPMFEIQPLEYSPALKQCILNLDQYDLLFFVSTNAATLGMRCIEHFWPQLPAHLRYFTVGPGTAEALAAFDVKAHYPTTGMDSEALLAMDELQDISGCKSLIVRGVGGREVLSAGLRERGASVDYAELYERRRPVYDAEVLDDCMRRHAADAIVISSSEGVLNRVQVLDAHRQALQQCLLLVSSQRIATQAETLGFEKVIVMAGANDAAIMASLDEQFS